MGTTRRRGCNCVGDKAHGTQRGGQDKRSSRLRNAWACNPHASSTQVRTERGSQGLINLFLLVGGLGCFGSGLVVAWCMKYVGGLCGLALVEGRIGGGFVVVAFAGMNLHSYS